MKGGGERPMYFWRGMHEGGGVRALSTGKPFSALENLNKHLRKKEMISRNILQKYLLVKDRSLKCECPENP